MNVYEQAAKRANVPAAMVNEVIVRTSTAMHDEIVSMLADQMHELVMDHDEEQPR